MPLRSDEIRDMADGDINARVAELEEERFRLKFRSATEPLENPLRLRTIRRDIARLKTILRERQLAVAAREAGGGGARAHGGR
jgi:large subunit ribosomal protein L29